MNQIRIDSYPFRRWFLEGSTDLPHYSVLIDYLVREFNNCYFCGIIVKIYPQVDGVKTPDDRATIEHLKSRNFRKRGEYSLKVLCCFRCNNDRNKAEERALKRGEI